MTARVDDACLRDRRCMKQRVAHTASLFSSRDSPPTSLAPLFVGRRYSAASVRRATAGLVAIGEDTRIGRGRVCKRAFRRSRTLRPCDCRSCAPLLRSGALVDSSPRGAGAYARSAPNPNADTPFVRYPTQIEVGGWRVAGAAHRELHSSLKSGGRLCTERQWRLGYPATSAPAFGGPIRSRAYGVSR